MKYQKLYNIFFSDDRSHRWKRHFLFWLAVWLYHFVRIGIMFPSINTLHSFFSLLELTIYWGIIINIIFSYSIVYYLIPKYLHRKKYFLFAVGILLLFIVMQVLGFVHTLILSGSPVGNAIGYHKGMMFLSAARPGFIRLFGNPPLIFGLFLSIKILKNWHLEQLRSESLVRENTNAELQLLKAQVHPHFLFNTLNNIYSFTLTQSPLAGALVKKLSDLLQYMIHECELPLVPLEKEIKLIQDYMGLEKVRYGDRLDMHVEIKGDYENKQIAPLLLIPFVENCFKHGASVMRGQQWIRLSIQINEDQLDFNLTNSKPLQANDANNKKGIGLANVLKRLELLYPSKHLLKIESTGDTYFVNLQVSLQQLTVQDQIYKVMSALQPV